MNVIILRGVSGSGKTTLANVLSKNNKDIVCCADDYFYQDGKYLFNQYKLDDAHIECRDKFESMIKEKSPLIILSNTNTKEDYFKDYKELAEENGYLVFVVCVENRHGNKNVHKVPQKIINKMSIQLYQSLKLK